MSDIKFTLPGKEGFIVTWPVILKVPVDGGDFGRVEVSADFVILPQDEIGGLQSMISDEGQRDLLKRVVKNLHGVAGPDGTQITWSTQADIALEWGFIKQGLLTAYAGALRGHLEKN